MKAAIVGLSGPDLSAAEAALLRAHPPAGIILFARNVVDPAQLRRLTGTLRAILDPRAVLMVDQEGGRVARLRPPHWRAHPPAERIGALEIREALRAAWLTGALIGMDCVGAGFDTVAAPVLDLRVRGAHDVIGDRAYATDPVLVARLGRAVAAGLMAGGVQPIGKHAPGHGRAEVDSHLSLPRVAANDLGCDVLPFARNVDLPWLMTAHIVYAALDPSGPATLSHRVVSGLIRQGLGFNGVIVTDDLAMKALDGAPADLARAALAAGCDLALYCPGDPEGTASVLRDVPNVSPDGLRRMAGARAAVTARRLALDPTRLSDERERLLA